MTKPNLRISVSLYFNTYSYEEHELTGPEGALSFIGAGTIGECGRNLVIPAPAKVLHFNRVMIRPEGGAPDFPEAWDLPTRAPSFGSDLSDEVEDPMLIDKHWIVKNPGFAETHVNLVTMAINGEVVHRAFMSKEGRYIAFERSGHTVIHSIHEIGDNLFTVALSWSTSHIAIGCMWRDSQTGKPLFNQRAASIPQRNPKRPGGPFKPTGTTGLYDAATGFQKVFLGTEKNEIEARVFALWKQSQFAWWKRDVSSSDVLGLGKARRDDEATEGLDFLVETKRGTRYIELMEVAPLEQFGGRYPDAREIGPISPQILADWVLGKLRRKALKYSSISTPILLLLYDTHHPFGIAYNGASKIITFELMKSPPIFEAVFYYSPIEAKIRNLHTSNPGHVLYWNNQEFIDRTRRWLEGFEPKRIVAPTWEFVSVWSGHTPRK